MNSFHSWDSKVHVLMLMVLEFIIENSGIEKLKVEAWG
jgi:hypothetical protein